MGMNTAAVQRLYVAYFNRPADPVGLAVYEAMLPSDTVATQAELQVLAETYFSPSAEYTTNFAGKSNTQIVNQLYQNIFGRTAEPDGLISWAAKLSDGSITVAELALQLSKKGAYVVCAARTIENLESICRKINREGNHSFAVQADITDKTQCDKIVKVAS